VTGIVLAGHGGLVDGFRDAAEMIMGPQEQLALVALGKAENMDVYQDKLRSAVGQVDSGEGTIIFVDLFGGSPSNAAAYLAREGTEVITGLSLPMLLEVLGARTYKSTPELVDTAMAAAQQGAVRLSTLLKAPTLPSPRGGGK
jgi:PTS system mannose-specific IIA component